MNTNIYDNYLYLDTNIYGYLCKNKCLIKPLSEYLFSNNLSIALTGANMSELHDAGFLHNDLIDILIQLPSSLLKSWDVILYDEIKSHPKMFQGSILGYPLNSLMIENDGIKKLKAMFNSPKLAEARKLQVKNSEKLYQKHLEVKNNFPPSTSGKYLKSQANEFSYLIAIQWLAKSYPQFLSQFKNDVSKLNTNVFLTIKMYALVIFYKYYLGNRNPVKKSDFGDLFHLSYIPYCKKAIMEKDICDTLNQIKRNEQFLNKIKIFDIRFFKNFN